MRSEIPRSAAFSKMEVSVIKRYVINRLLWMIFVLVGTTILIFSIMYLVPGDLADLQLGITASAEEKEAFRELYGLNDPYIVRLWNYVTDVFLHFDFGISFVYKVPAMDELLSRIPRTLALGCACIALNTIIGIPLGLVAALHQNKWQDYLCMFVALAGASIPEFVFAFMCILLFSTNLGWLPAFGIGGIKYYILPVLSGSLTGIATNSRQTRSAMLEVIRADYVTTARAKGLAERNVVVRHMLPNALIPVVTVLGGGIAKSIAGMMIIENVFSIPGVGTYLTRGVTSLDFPVVQGSVIVLSFFSAAVMLLVDIIYAYIDPRIKARYVGSAKRKRRVKV